jgi:curved DNA-binding protein CbpA
MTNDALDPYRSLGVGPHASAAQIRTAYLNLARLLHPDLFRSAPEGERRLAERRMREVNESYAVLRDPARRSAYDRSRPTSERAERLRGTDSTTAPTTPPR